MLAALSPGVTPETIRNSRGLPSTPIHVYTATVPSTWDRLSSSGYCGDTLWTRRNGLGFMQPGCESDPAGGSKSSGRKLLCCFKLCNLNLGQRLPTLNIAQKTRKQLWPNRHHVFVKKCPLANQCTCRRVYADLSSVLVLVVNFSAFYFGTVHFAVLNSLIVSSDRGVSDIIETEFPAVP